MAKKNLQARIDETILEQAREVFSSMGLDIPTAINVFFLTVIHTGKIPFTIQSFDSDDIYTEEDRQRISEAAAEVERGEVYSLDQVKAQFNIK